MSSMPWIKLYTEMLDDAKIGRLEDAVKWRFVSLLLLAGECDQDGALMTSEKPMSLDDIAWRMRVTREQCETEIESLLMCGVVALDADLYYLPKFGERQGRPQSEKRAMWRERQARLREHKETKESVTRDSPVTNASRVDKNRSDKTSAEKAPRKRDLLFDAIAEVCGIDPATAGSSIAKVESVLKKSEPPYTPEEVRAFGVKWWEWKERTTPPTIWKLKEQIGTVRQNGNGAHKPEETTAPRKVYR